MNEQHSPGCLTQMAAQHQLRHAWMTQWPHYCTQCQGRGQFEERYDPSPAGVSLSSGYMIDIEPCEECTNQGICPRCGQLGMIDYVMEEGGADPCTMCGWRYTDRGVPEEAECFCWPERLYAEYAALYTSSELESL